MIQHHHQVQLKDEDMNRLISSHRIDPKAMREDDFEKFFANRATALLEIIGRVMGKEIAQLSQAEPEENFEVEVEAA